MENEHHLEIYRQRYEVFRHFDALRWQLFQTAIATAGIVMALGKDSIAANSTWTYGAMALILLSIGIGLLRISSGVRKNNKMLKLAAEKIGDNEIPGRTHWYNSVLDWIAFAMISIGLFELYKFCTGLATV